MFQKSKINEPIDARAAAKPAAATAERQQLPERPAATTRNASAPTRSATPSSPSMIAPDLRVIGNLVTDGDLQIEGQVEGDINANTLIVGKSAVVKGEIRSNDVTVNGRVIGKIKGRKVRLTDTAHVDGDILHSSISIEAGGHFEGSIHRADDPLKDDNVATPKVMELTNPDNKNTGKAS